MKEAYNYLSKFINKNDYVVIANSGGPDSMALLSLLIKYREKVKDMKDLKMVQMNKQVM